MPATTACPKSGPEKLGRKSQESFHGHCSGNSWGQTSSSSPQMCPSGAASRPTEQTCGVKSYQKHPDARPSTSSPWHSVAHPSLLAWQGFGNAGGGTNLCGSCLNWGTQLLLETGANTLWHCPPPPASLGAVRELLVSHQPSMPDPTQLRAGVSHGCFSPASASLPSLLFSPPTRGRQDSRVPQLILPAAGMLGRVGLALGISPGLAMGIAGTFWRRGGARWLLLRARGLCHLPCACSSRGTAHQGRAE